MPVNFNSKNLVDSFKQTLKFKMAPETKIRVAKGIILAADVAIISALINATYQWWLNPSAIIPFNENGINWTRAAAHGPILGLVGFTGSVVQGMMRHVIKNTQMELIHKNKILELEKKLQTQRKSQQMELNNIISKFEQEVQAKAEAIAHNNKTIESLSIRTD